MVDVRNFSMFRMVRQQHVGDQPYRENIEPLGIQGRDRVLPLHFASRVDGAPLER